MIDHHFKGMAFVLREVEEVSVITLGTCIRIMGVFLTVINFGVREAVVLFFRIEHCEIKVFTHVARVHIRVLHLAVLQVVRHTVGFPVVVMALFAVETSIVDEGVQLAVVD
jgi:hypothetical protein